MDSGSQTEFSGISVNAATVQTVYCSVQFEEYILASVIGIAQCSHVVQNKVKNQPRDKKREDILRVVPVCHGIT